ncbi:MAG: alpha/beta hydrolase [Myxococcales bacterium]|nr:alpha/beta hydrolase [Myxococcales bacterium]USN51363.1 MAG: alpha/beta hydrolase [Myxococcales bacterium]
MGLLKALLIPGNGGGGPKDNWFPFLAKELPRFGIDVIAEEFPDNILARARFWLPHIKALGADENTILIGHSSGAIAAMRYAENNKILGSALVGAYHTHLNMDAEIQSGYFDQEWNFEAIKENQQWIGIFAGKDDPWIPVQEARFLNDRLDAFYFEFPNAGHFGSDYDKKSFEELLCFIKVRTQK